MAVPQGSKQSRYVNLMLFLLSVQNQNVMTQTFVWLVAPVQIKAEWSFAVKECGELCVMTLGIRTMPW